MYKNAKWLPEVVDFLKANIAGKTKAELAEMLNEKFGTDFTKFAVSTKCTELGINAGLKQMTENRINANIAKRKPIGYERDVKGYVKVKVAHPSVWRFKHHVVWEQKSGRPLAKNERVIFLDGNTRNFTPENLEAVSPAIQGIVNSHFGGTATGNASETKIRLAAAMLMQSRVEFARNHNAVDKNGNVRQDINVRACKYNAAHREERNARLRERYATDTEWREKKQAAHREWLARKKEEARNGNLS